MAFLVPYSRKPVTQFSPLQSVGIKKNLPQSMEIKKNPPLRGTLFSTHALRGIKNKKSGEYFKIRILK
jgi:hypothetical protein